MFRVLAIGVGVSLLACSPALATTQDLGTLSNVTPAFASGTLTKTNTYDIVDFTLAGADGVGGSLREFIFNRSSKYQFTSLTATFYKDGTTTNPVAVLQENIDQNFLISDGKYYAKVSGVLAKGAKAGSYTLALLAGSAAPAPGPDGWLVMGAGLGAVMLLKRRASRSAGQLAAA